MSPARPPSLWELCRALASAPAPTIEAVAAQVPATLSLVDENEHVRFLAGGPLKLGDGTALGGIELRVLKATNAATLLLLEVEAPCIGLTDVRRAFPSATLTDVPRGLSENEQAFWAVQSAKASLAFGFAEHRADCVASVAIGW
ncbi:MAG: hypothetical protein JSW68_12280 [Burkholderiales bacterium]|nr:MAG: hypothetical protein JSW68_12280 [Burkholderiales bacterium]